jgi:hypothetical protein
MLLIVIKNKKRFLHSIYETDLIFFVFIFIVDFECELINGMERKTLDSCGKKRKGQDPACEAEEVSFFTIVKITFLCFPAERSGRSEMERTCFD